MIDYIVPLAVVTVVYFLGVIIGMKVERMRK